MSDECTDGIKRTADVMFQNYDEAKLWVENADLWNYPLVLEDHFDGEHVATAKIKDSHDSYRVEITNHEGQETTSQQTVDHIEVAEMMGGWCVAGRLLEPDTGRSE